MPNFEVVDCIAAREACSFDLYHMKMGAALHGLPCHLLQILINGMPPKHNQPRFISIEGNIGSGKSTILNIIR